MAFNDKMFPGGFLVDLLLVTKLGSQDHQLLTTAETKIASVTSKLLLLIDIHKYLTCNTSRSKLDLLNQQVLINARNM